MEWITPVTDRTLADIESVKSLKERIYTAGWQNLTEEEKTTFLGDMVGTLNYITLNRIECNTQHMEEVLENLGFLLRHQAYMQDWTLQALPTKKDFERLLSNIESHLRTFYYMETALPENLQKPTYGELNAVEQVLLELKQASDLVIQGWKYCGTFHCGQSLVLPQRGES